MTRDEAVSTKSGHILALLIAFYLLITIPQSLFKLVWGDELFTFYIARQPGIAGIWQALRAGADPNPPLMHLLVKLSTNALGQNSLAIRIPAILCVLLAIAAMWSILRRWLTPLYAAAGILAFMATRGFDYAYDARSYAPMLGFAMAALALWMASSDLTGPRRLAALVGMALALAAGISSNYYCVLAFFPIAAGEAAGTKASARLRLDVWLALILAALPILAYLPLIRHNIAEFAPHAWNHPQPSMILWSYLELVEGIFWPVLFLAICAVWRRRDTHVIPTPEAVAVATLIIYPFLGFAIALAGADMISPRCVAPVCCGFGLAAGSLGQRVFGDRRRAGITMVLILLLWLTIRECICANILLEQRQAFGILCGEVAMDASDPTGQILVSDSSFVLPLYFYSREEVRRRIVFPIDFEAIHCLQPDDSGEQNLWAGRNGVFPFPIVPFQSLSLSSNMTVVASPEGWLANSIRLSGVPLQLDNQTSDWSRVGGVFTPMAHPETRILHPAR